MQLERDSLSGQVHLISSERDAAEQRHAEEMDSYRLRYTLLSRIAHKRHSKLLEQDLRISALESLLGVHGSKEEKLRLVEVDLQKTRDALSATRLRLQRTIQHQAWMPDGSMPNTSHLSPPSSSARSPQIKMMVPDLGPKRRTTLPRSVLPSRNTSTQTLPVLVPSANTKPRSVSSSASTEVGKRASSSSPQKRIRESTSSLSPLPPHHRRASSPLTEERFGKELAAQLFLNVRILIEMERADRLAIVVGEVREMNEIYRCSAKAWKVEWTKLCREASQLMRRVGASPILLDRDSPLFAGIQRSHLTTLVPPSLLSDDDPEIVSSMGGLQLNNGSYSLPSSQARRRDTSESARRGTTPPAYLVRTPPSNSPPAAAAVQFVLPTSRRAEERSASASQQQHPYLL